MYFVKYIFILIIGMAHTLVQPAPVPLKPKFSRNRVREYRENQLMSKAELSRRAAISPITLSRIETGLPCRLDTKRKIILALGLKLTERTKVFLDLR